MRFRVIINGDEKDLLKEGYRYLNNDDDLSFSLLEPFVVFYRNGHTNKIEKFHQCYRHSKTKRITSVECGYYISDGIDCSVCFGDPFNPKEYDVVTDVDVIKFTFLSKDLIRIIYKDFEMGDVIPESTKIYEGKREAFNMEVMELFDKYFKN